MNKEELETRLQILENNINYLAKVQTYILNRHLLTRFNTIASSKTFEYLCNALLNEEQRDELQNLLLEFHKTFPDASAEDMKNMDEVGIQFEVLDIKEIFEKMKNDSCQWIKMNE